MRKSAMLGCALLEALGKVCMNSSYWSDRMIKARHYSSVSQRDSTAGNVNRNVEDCLAFVIYGNLMDYN